VGKRKSLKALQVLLSSSQNTDVISTVLVTNSKHSTLWPAMKKINFIPATLNTPSSFTWHQPTS